MRHIVVKLAKSNFQRYKVRVNQSSNGRVMAPGSRGVGAIFSPFSGEDFGQMGDATGKLKVASRSWSCSLYNTPGLADQIAVSRKESVREGVPDVGFQRSWYGWKACATLFFKVLDLLATELGLERYGPMNKGHWGVFDSPEGNFPVKIPARPEKILTIREFHAVSEHVLFLKVMGGGQLNPTFGQVNTSAKPWSNLVNPGQTWSNLPKLREMCSRPHLEVPLTRWTLVGSTLLGLGRPVLRVDTRENPEGIPKVKEDQTGYEKATHGTRFGNPESKHVGGNSGFGNYPNLKSGENPEFKHVGGNLGFGNYPNLKSGDQRFGNPESKHVGGNLRFGNYPNLNSGDPTMSGQGSGRGGQRRSDRLAKGKAVAYAPDTDDEYAAMEDPRTRDDSVIARNLQEELDAGCWAPAGASPVRSASKRRRADRVPLSADPVPEDFVAPGVRYPPQGDIQPRYHVITPMVDTPLLTNLIDHPSSSVQRCEDPSSESTGRGGWSDFCKLLGGARREYSEFLTKLGFGPFLSIPYVYVSHPLVRCWVERFFHHTRTFHLSTCEMGVLPVDWSAILGIRFGGKAPPSEPVSGPKALDILGLDDPSAIEGIRSTSLRFSCFLGNDKSTVPTPIVGMFRDVDTLRDYDWGALTYGFYIRGLCRFSRQETNGFLGFWQFILFWAFKHFPCFGPSRLLSTPDPAFPLARHWDSARIKRLTSRTLLECRTTVDYLRDVDVVFQPYSPNLVERTKLFKAVRLSRLRIWIRTSRSWELLMGERTVRQLGGDAIVPVDPPSLMTIEGYIPNTPSDSYVKGVDYYLDLVRAKVPYQEWFTQISLGPLMSIHEVEGSRVIGGMAMDNHHIRSTVGVGNPTGGGVGPAIEGGGPIAGGVGLAAC
uniref:Aminotransferase-like plant mobile domain-containing protein n=1 Tax=Fagus sylvatica TaxID=28930 RepID=A0A2N9I3T6_FAGSY